MMAFDEQGFEKKLMNLKDTQESVSQLSHWCLVNKQHHKKIVTLWLSVLKKVKVESRLTLFHLANDVIQYSKRKNLEFVDSWGTALQRATPMVRDEKVQKKILRIFKIWGERNIYEETFLTDLCGLLTTTTKKSSAQPQTHSKSHHEKPVPVAIPLVFEPQNLFLKIRDCVKLENDTDLKMKYVNECPLALNDVDSLRASLKDRSHGDEAVAEIDDAIERMKAYEDALRIEVQERRTLIELLRHGETFYENERGEAKVVFNAYRNFGSRVKSVKRKLDELIPTLSSPIPSPDVNAPSPSPDSDIELPNDEDLSDKNKQVPQPIKSMVPANAPAEMGEFDTRFTSFMGSASLPFDIQRNLFGDTSASQTRMPSPALNSRMDQSLSPGDNSEQGKPIEVISMRSKSEDDDFGIGNFLKSLASGSNTTSGGIPGLGDPLPVPPPIIPPSTTSYSYQLSLGAPPLQPPPLPPVIDSALYTSQSQNETSETQDREDAWKTTLPPKFPTWSDAAENEWERDSVGSEPQEPSDWVPALPVNKVTPGHGNVETPESPPHFEKESFREPVEYDETSVGTRHGVSDVDHRMLVSLSTPCRKTVERSAPPSAKDIDHRVLNSRLKKDVDHRNLISLTGSPANDVLAPPPSPPQLWSHDQDYRSIPMPPSKEDRERKWEDHDHRRGRAPDGVVDNVESVDMELSDDEDDFHAAHARSGSTSQDKKWHDKQSGHFDHHMIPTLGSQHQRSSAFPPLPPPPPPPIPRPDFQTDLRVPPPPLDFLPMRQDAYSSPGIESNSLGLGDVFPPVPPEYPPVVSLLGEPPIRAGPGPVLGPGVPPIIPPGGPPPPRPLIPPILRTNHVRLDLRSPLHSPAHRRTSVSSRESPPVASTPTPATPPTTAPAVAHDDKTPQKPAVEAPSGPEESDTDSMEQYMNTVGLSDDEEFKAIVGAMDPQFIRDVVEGPSRNGVDEANGEKTSPKDGPPTPSETQTPTQVPTVTPTLQSPQDSMLNQGQTPPSGRGAFNQTPRSRPWKHRGGGRGGFPMTSQRFHGPRAGSPGWERSPFHHGRGRPGIRPLLSGGPRGMPFRAVMRGNPRFGW